MQMWDLLAIVWTRMALGGGLLIIAAGTGWALGGQDRLWPIRALDWWIGRVVIPLVRCPRWSLRFVVILINNGSILSILLLAGQWPIVPVFAVAATGLSLGIGLRLLSDRADEPIPPSLARSAVQRLCVQVGVAFNLLEPPAIALTVGLSLGLRGVPLDGAVVWNAFLWWVLPATALAAGGEALWLGVGIKNRRLERTDTSKAPDDDVPT